MPRLLIRMNMFTASQMAYVINFQGEVQKTFTLSVDKLDREVLRICEDEKIQDIIISGPMIYTRRFMKKIAEAELIKYNQSKYNIRLVK